MSPCRYNPENDTESRLLRHRALALQDMAQSFLDHELSEEFEKVSCVRGGREGVHLVTNNDIYTKMAVVCAYFYGNGTSAM